MKSVPCLSNKKQINDDNNENQPKDCHKAKANETCDNTRNQGKPYWYR